MKTFFTDLFYFSLMLFAGACLSVLGGLSGYMAYIMINNKQDTPVHITIDFIHSNIDRKEAYELLVLFFTNFI